MNHRIMWALGLVVAALSGCSGDERDVPVKPLDAPSVDPRSAMTTTGIPEALQAAHKAYLAEDLVALGERLRDVLVDPATSPLVRENALALLDRSYEVGKGALPSSFTLPPGLGRLQYAVRRFATPHGASYQVRFAGSARDASHLTGVTVRVLSGGLVMDRATRQGSFSVRHDAWSRTHGTEEFVLDSPMLDQPPPAGPVSLRLELDDGSVAEGFILVPSFSAVTGPVIESPGSTISRRDPLVRWTTPRLTGASSGRSRTNLSLTREGDEQSLWDFSDSVAREAHEVVLGASSGSSTVSLAPGDHWLSVSAVESRSFGPVEVLWGSRVSRPLRVTD